MKHKNWNRAFIVSSLLVGLQLFSGCAHSPKIAHRNVPWNDYLVEQKEKKKLLSAVLVDLHLEIDSPQQKVSGDGQWLTTPEGDRIEITDFLGRLHFLLVRNPKEMVVAYPQQKSVIRDRPSGEKYFREVLGAPQDFAVIRAYALGLVNSNQIDPQELILKSASGEWRVEYSDYDWVEVAKGQKVFIAKKVIFKWKKSSLQLEFGKFEKPQAISKNSFTY